jgi:predicted phage terminase large subunit-like protein
MSRSLYEFIAGYERKDGRHVPGAWERIDPSPFVGGWHLEAIAEHLEAVIAHVTGGDGINRLIVNVPPRTGKSTSVSVAWPVWAWILHPEIRWLFTSYAERLAVRDARKSRTLITDQWYRDRWGERYSLLGDQNEKSRYENDKGGYRLSSSFGGSSTGEGGDIIVADDPHKADDAQTSDIKREDVLEEWDTTFSTRLNDSKTGAFVIIMQRLHEKDLTGHVLAKNAGYVHLCLPMEYSRSHPFIWPDDPRIEDGELLQPERFGPAQVKALKEDLQARASAGQLQQLPAPEDGITFHRADLERYWLPRKSVPCTTCDSAGRVGADLSIICPRCHGVGDLGYWPEVDERALSWDMAFKNTAHSSFVVGAVWGRKGAKKYLLDLVRARMDFTETLEAFKAQVQKWPDAHLRLVEEKANGAAVISALKKEIPGIVPVNPDKDGGKEARANAVSPQFQAHDVMIPHPSIAPWVGEWVEEHIKFPNGENNDQVDTTTQILLRWGVRVSTVGVSEQKVWE